MSLQAPLARVLGLGSAKEGSGHWWSQRLTAVALAPLTLWFAFSMLSLYLDGNLASHEFIVAWIAEPLHAIGMILLVLTVVYHSGLGLQVVVEDYLHGAAGVVTLIFVKFLHVALAVAGTWAVIVVSLRFGQ